MLPNNQTADTKLVVDRDTHTIVLTRMLAAPREQVFEAWTTPEHVRCWWDPEGQPLTICEIDLRPGGSFRFVSRNTTHAFAGVYREITPPDRLVFEAMGATGRVIFEEARSKTHLTIRIECGSAALLDQYLEMGVDTGTASTLANLAAHVEARQL